MLKTDAEVAKERRAKKRKEQDAVDALILAKQNRELEQSRDTWMDVAVELDQKLAASQERVDFLEAALEAKSQSYEEDMTALEERLSSMRRGLEAAMLALDAVSIQLSRGDADDTSIGALQRVSADISQLLSAAPAGQVVWRGEGHIYHETDVPEYGSEPYTSLEIEAGVMPLDDGHIGIDGQSVIVTIRATPEEQGAE